MQQSVGKFGKRGMQDSSRVDQEQSMIVCSSLFRLLWAGMYNAFRWKQRIIRNCAIRSNLRTCHWRWPLDCSRRTSLLSSSCVWTKRLRSEDLLLFLLSSTTWSKASISLTNVKMNVAYLPPCYLLLGSSVSCSLIASRFWTGFYVNSQLIM